MKNNNIQEEGYDKEIPNRNQSVPETSWSADVLGVVIVACIASVIITLILRLDKWLIR